MIFLVTFTSLLKRCLISQKTLTRRSINGSEYGFRNPPKFKKPPNKISSSKWMLEMISSHLASKWDVEVDGKTMLRQDLSASGDSRKRKAEGRNEENMTFNNRRKGRLPPSSTEPSRDTFWTQGTHSQSLTRSGTLLESSSLSATRVSTRSQSLCSYLGSYSRSSKATSTHRR